MLMDGHDQTQIAGKGEKMDKGGHTDEDSTDIFDQDEFAPKKQLKLTPPPCQLVRHSSVTSVDSMDEQIGQDLTNYFKHEVIPFYNNNRDLFLVQEGKNALPM